MYTQIPRLKFFQATGALIQAVGGYKVVAAACDVTTDNVNKWKQNPDGNGQWITVQHLQTLFALTGQQLANLAAQNAADALIQEHFLNLFYRRAYPEEKVFEFIEMLSGQKTIKVVNE